MNTQSNAEPHSPLNSQEIAPAAISATRLLYWSVRRELWEYRFIYLAPLAAAGVALFGFLISMIGRTHWMGSLTTLHSAHLASPYDATAGVMMGTMILVAVFYC